MSRKEVNKYYHELRLRDNFLDLLYAPRYALKFRILYTAFISIVLSYTVVLSFSFVSIAFFEKYYNAFRFFGIIPIALPSDELPYLANLILFLGYIFAFFIFQLGASGIAVQIVETLKGDRNFRLGNVKKFLRDNYFTIVFPSVGFSLIISFFFSLGILLSFLLDIPVAGIALKIVVIPILVLLGIFLLFSTVSMGVSIILTPAITAMWNQDAFGGIFQAYSILWSRPWMLITGIITAAWNMLFTFLLSFALFSGGFWLIHRLTQLDILSIPMDQFPQLNFGLYEKLQFLFKSSDLSGLDKALTFWYIIFFILALSLALGAFVSTTVFLLIRIKKKENDIDLVNIP